MRVASIDLRACCFKPKWAARISIRGELRRPTFGCEVVSRLAWSSIPPSCRDQGPLASRPKESVGGLHLWRRTRLAERAERISSAVSLLRMTLAMCGYSVSIILSRQYRKSCTCYGVRSRGRKMSAEGRKGESDRRASPIFVSKVSSSGSTLAGTGRYRDERAKLWVPYFQRSEPDVS